MKLAPNQVAAFLKAPGGTRVVLLHGDDEGLVRTRADALALGVLGAKDDPFRLAWLGPEDHGRLLEEATAIAMLGGRRVVRVRNPTDTLTPLVQQVLEGPGDALVLLEAGGLRKGKLQTLVEAAPHAAALPCYPEEPGARRTTIAGALAAANVRADADALDWLRDHLGGDHAGTLREVEKLILYAGEDRRLDLDAVRDCIGDQGAGSLDDALYSATAGRTEAADLALERTMAEGTAPVGVVRATIAHLTRMHLARGRMDEGASAKDAVAAIRPPVFWKRQSDLAQALPAWPTPRLSTALAEARRAELACKTTGAPDDAIARRLVLALARAGRR